MGALRFAGALWIMAGITCAGLLIVVFIGENLANLGVLLDDPVLPALVLGGAIMALLIGSLLVNRPGPGVVRWSNLAGVAWLIGFGPLVIAGLAAPESGPLLSSSLIAGFGLAGALVGFWSRDTVQVG
jgi:hypothetical protein